MLIYTNIRYYSWIAPPIDGHTKYQFQNKPEGLRQIRDHVRKALGKENPDLLGFFCVTIFDLFFENNFKNIVRTKICSPGRIGFTSSNSLVPSLRSF